MKRSSPTHSLDAPNKRRRRSSESASTNAKGSSSTVQDLDKPSIDLTGDDAVSDTTTVICDEDEDFRRDDADNKDSGVTPSTSSNVEQPPRSEVYVDPRLRLLRVHDLPDAQNVWSRGLRDIFGERELASMLQLNYMFELEWMLSHLPARSRNIQITVVHGLRERESKEALQSEARAHSNVNIITPHLPIPFGTHHTKSMVLVYTDGTMRVIVHTANMISRDWKNKSQGIWTSPLLRKKQGDELKKKPTSQFEADFLAYMGAYGPALRGWCETLEQYDYSPCRAVLIGSVPGQHAGKDIAKWGHMRLRAVLNRVRVNAECAQSSTVIGQFSSIGSLGLNDRWLRDEFGASLFAAQNKMACRQPDLRLVFPTVENVRTSLEGWAAGGSIPFDSKNWAKQKGYMRPILCKWRAVAAGRERAMPHIKTYCRVSPGGNLAWFLLSSANLSKAAWGSLEKKGTQLMVRSYELGVLVYPDLFDHGCGGDLGRESKAEMRNVTGDIVPFIPLVEDAPVVGVHEQVSGGNRDGGEDSGVGKIVIPIRLPYDLPLTPYGPNDEAWTWNERRYEPDVFGFVKDV
ncbi:hypothetical protein HK104_009113 [Borealophlyctis nickersoniae]|nr:hypothetical protein HK104_009113 [Borealophlyctis nickersoniae]